MKKYEPILLEVFQAKWPNRYIIKVTVVPHINNDDARKAIELGGTFRVLRRDRVSSR